MIQINVAKNQTIVEIWRISSQVMHTNGPSVLPGAVDVLNIAFG